MNIESNYYDTAKNKPLALVDDGAFGKCPSCGYEFNSELINEYDVKFCIRCGQPVIH